MIQGSQTRNAIAGLIQKPPEGVADLVDEMDRDYQVKLSDLTLCSGVKQVKVTFTTDNGDERAEAVKEYGEKLYYDTLSSMLAFLKYGRVAYERAWKYEPKTNLNTFDLNELPFRQTKMLLRNGEFAGIELKGKDEEKNPVTVNLDKPYAFWLAYNAKPTAPHGASNYVGAPCETYFERKNTRRMLRTFLDKYALGNRILYGPEKIPDPTHPDPNTAPMVPFADVVRPVLQVLEAGGWLILSNERQQSAGPNGMVDVGYKIEVKTDEGLPQNSEPILRVLEEQDSWQLLAFGIPPKTVTEGSEVGSFAMVAQQRVVLLALFEEIFLQIQKQFQAGVLDVLCEMNGCGPVTMDYTPLTERPDDLASEVVKAWLTDPKLSELVASGTVDILGLLEATAIPVTPEGKERLTKLITRLANPPAQPTNPDGTIKTPEQLKAEYAVKTGEDPDAGKPAPKPEPGGESTFALSSPFIATLWPGGSEITALCGANGPGGDGFQSGNTCGKGGGGSAATATKKPKSKGKSFSESQANALKDYTTDKFQSINGELRSGKVGKANAHVVKEMDSALESAEKYAKPTVRSFSIPDGEEAKFREMLREGGTFEDKAYVSSRKSPTVTDKAAFQHKVTARNQVVMRIAGKRGVDISHLSLNSGEGEVLFPRGSRFRVVKVVYTPAGGILAEVEEL